MARTAIRVGLGGRQVLRVAGALAAVLALAAPAAQAADLGTVVYADGNGDIVARPADGSGAPKVLAGGAAAHRTPEISPDGREVAYSSSANGFFNVWVMDISGANQHQVRPNNAQPEGSASDPAWSPDGSELAYICGCGAIHAIGANGSGDRVLFTPPPSPDPLESVYDHGVTWSPDGTQVAFAAGEGTGARARIVVMDASGANPQEVSAGPGQDLEPDWSPDGTRIAFQRLDGGALSIVVLDLSTGQETVIPFSGTTPTWSPDGSRLMVHDIRGGGRALTTMDPDGTDVRVVVPAAGVVRGLSWGGGGDADGDALLDEWESFGIDRDGDGAIDLDLPGMGADPLHKDVFVEIDAMPPHQLERLAVDMVVQAFADAPVANPDGTTGIALHVDNGPGSVMNPRTGDLWGAQSNHDSIAHVDVLGSVAGGSYDWTDFDALRAQHFAEEREPAFHYAISAHGHDGTASGISRGIGASDFIVTLGAGCQSLSGGADCTLGAKEQAGTLMHELGHDLGLRHGGDDDVAYKPSYLSIMNYAYQLTGLWLGDLSTRLDYARAGVAMNEAALDESAGFGFGPASPQAAFLALGHCPGGAQVLWALLAAPTDFDCDGTLDPGTISSDTNNDGAIGSFNAHVDWPNLVFDGGQVGDLGVVIGPGQTERMEPPLAELVTARKVFDDFAAAAGRPAPPPAGPPGGAPAPAPAAAARLAALAIRPAAFRARRRGAVVTFRLSAAARVRFRVERVLAGRRRGRACVAPRRAPRGNRCRRTAPVRGAFQREGDAGANRFRFSGRVAGRALKPGRYALVATPLAPDGTGGDARRTGFRILG